MLDPLVHEKIFQEFIPYILSTAYLCVVESKHCLNDLHSDKAAITYAMGAVKS